MIESCGVNEAPLLFEGGHENVAIDFGDGVVGVRVVVFWRVGMFCLFFEFGGL